MSRPSRPSDTLGPSDMLDISGPSESSETHVGTIGIIGDIWTIGHLGDIGTFEVVGNVICVHVWGRRCQRGRGLSPTTAAPLLTLAPASNCCTPTIYCSHAHQCCMLHTRTSTSRVRSTATGSDPADWRNVADAMRSPVHVPVHGPQNPYWAWTPWQWVGGWRAQGKWGVATADGTGRTNAESGKGIKEHLGWGCIGMQSAPSNTKGRQQWRHAGERVGSAAVLQECRWERMRTTGAEGCKGKGGRESEGMGGAASGDNAPNEALAEHAHRLSVLELFSVRELLHADGCVFFHHEWGSRAGWSEEGEEEEVGRRSVGGGSEVGQRRVVGEGWSVKGGRRKEKE
ncbi:hypothetical protein OF83DRAFT_1088446 [Amylostereum chailletii]|nr:hypothetical protein OF83DRAFT_1088446 [Amylostereum chailletii]